MQVVNLRAVVGILGILVFFLGIALLFPLGVGLYDNEPAWNSFGVSALLSMVVGGGLWYFFRPRQELQPREGFAIVALAWFVLSLLGALPFVLSGVLDSFTDAFFETMSGFTTTGATILGGTHTPDIEALPKSLLFWRSFTHWLGGMGIIVLTLAILPMLGVGGMQLFKAEVPGPSADKLTPRVKETAKRLWLIYLGLTLIQILLLWPVMSGFDAINHAFATMATGGFSTQNGSVGQYNSAYIDWVIIIFMFLAGINFALYYRILRGKTRSAVKDGELWLYAAVIIAATILVTLSLYQPVSLGGHSAEHLNYDRFFEALRQAAFQVVAIVTTTGFGTSDYEWWPPLALGIIFLLFMTGGMAGSTAGGVKMIRHLLLYKNSYKEVKRLLHPNAVLPVRFNNRVVPPDVMRNVLSFMVFYAFLVAIGTFMMALLGMDLLSAIGATLSCIGNIGPGFGTIGPTENYAHLPGFAKWFLSLLMMAGRLEIFTVLVLFAPTFWRR